MSEKKGEILYDDKYGSIRVSVSGELGSILSGVENEESGILNWHSVVSQRTRRRPLAHTRNASEPLMGSQEVFEHMVRERLRQAVRVALIDLLEEEVSALIGARPYERSKERRDDRTGHYLRDLETTVGLVADLPVPRTRGGHQTQVLERSHRRREAPVP